MKKKQELKNTFLRRKTRTRFRLRKVADQEGKPRFSVFRSSRHIYAQIIDDQKGITLVSASSLEKKNRESCKGWNCSGAAFIGEQIAERALERGIVSVVFDRGGYIYHGIIKALAQAAREKGLQF